MRGRAAPGGALRYSGFRRPTIIETVGGWNIYESSARKLAAWPDAAAHCWARELARAPAIPRARGATVHRRPAQRPAPPGPEHPLRRPAASAPDETAGALDRDPSGRERPPPARRLPLAIRGRIACHQRLDCRWRIDCRWHPRARKHCRWGIHAGQESSGRGSSVPCRRRTPPRIGRRPVPGERVPTTSRRARRSLAGNSRCTQPGREPTESAKRPSGVACVSPPGQTSVFTVAIVRALTEPGEPGALSGLIGAPPGGKTGIIGKLCQGRRQARGYRLEVRGEKRSREEVRLKPRWSVAYFFGPLSRRSANSSNCSSRKTASNASSR